ncbi:MAG: patatin-like phospholipase family protein, partial [bacterium]
EDLWIPYFCVSSNLSRAEVVVHDDGPLWLWTRASSAVPGITPPVPYRGDLLVDGGVLNNLPADIMRERCRGSVIAVDVSASVELRTTLENAPELSGWPHLARALNPLNTNAAFPNILRVLSRTATLGSVANQEAMEDVADLYLHPPTDSVDPLNWRSIDDVVGIGYRYSFDRIAEWKKSENRISGTRVAIRRSSSVGEAIRR